MPELVIVEKVEIRVTDAATRLPFKFGAVVLTAAPIVVARVSLGDGSGGVVTGHASDLAVPKWFEKDPVKTVQEDSAALIRSALAARDVLLDKDYGAQTAFHHWSRMEEARVGDRDEGVSDVLVRGFGVALLERALIDAVCKSVGLSFRDALRSDALGFRPGEIHEALAQWEAPWLSDQEQPTSIALRHTVGMLDPLVASDVEDPIQDGLPHTLEEDIEKYGLTHFKIKVGGDPVADQSRLRQIAVFLTSRGLEAAPFTLDANEQYQDLDSLLELLQTLASDPETARFMDGLLFVEQPLPRSETFDETQREPLARLSAVCGVIIDEADYGVHAFRRALELGYQGVSIKNCKGVFRALINCGLADVMGEGAFQSAEDLTNTGIIPLQQNLATLGVLNQSHVEMNGHHYFRGLDHLPDEEVRWALSQRPGLYEAFGDGASLLVKGGRVDLTSVQGVGFGGVEAMAFETRQEAEAWLESVQ